MVKLVKKEEFLAEHNRLSPPNLQATMAMLNRFKEEKKPMLKDAEWCVDKLRGPFILWILSTKPQEAEKEKRGKEAPKYKNYPETHFS